MKPPMFVAGIVLLAMSFIFYIMQDMLIAQAVSEGTTTFLSLVFPASLVFGGLMIFFSFRD